MSHNAHELYERDKNTVYIERPADIILRKFVKDIYDIVWQGLENSEKSLTETLEKLRGMK